MPSTCIGPGLQFANEGGTVIGLVRMGRHCTVAQGVTLGRSMLNGDGSSYADRPALGDRVWLGPGAVIAGQVEVGSDAAVGANSIVLRDVPPRGVVPGVPVRLFSHRGSFTQVTYRGMEEDTERGASQRDIGALDDTERSGATERPDRDAKELDASAVIVPGISWSPSLQASCCTPPAKGSGLVRRGLLGGHVAHGFRHLRDVGLCEALALVAGEGWGR